MSKKTVLLLCVVTLGVAADQLTKYLAVSRLTNALEGREGIARAAAFVSEQNLDGVPTTPKRPRVKLHDVQVVENYWNFRYVENPGAAWGMFANLPDGVREPFFVVISLVAVGFIIWMYRRVERDHRLLQWALALVMAGAVGNFIDRLLRGYVIDFIDWHWRNQPGMRWPTFNVADMCISVGAVLMIADGLFGWLRRRRAAPAQVTDAQQGEPPPAEIEQPSPPSQV